MPFQVLKVLRKAGYKVKTVADIAQPGIRNDKLAELSINLKMVIITRDADFTHLRKTLAEKIKVIYVRLQDDPETIAETILTNLPSCLKLLEQSNIILLNNTGCQILR